MIVIGDSFSWPHPDLQVALSFRMIIKAEICHYSVLRFCCIIHQTNSSCNITRYIRQFCGQWFKSMSRIVPWQYWIFASVVMYYFSDISTRFSQKSTFMSGYFMYEYTKARKVHNNITIYNSFIPHFILKCKPSYDALTFPQSLPVVYYIFDKSARRRFFFSLGSLYMQLFLY